MLYENYILVKKKGKHIMTVTIKKIAEVSGVSRGTVDRVLNNRGRVNEETASKVRSCAEMLGYTPNIAGKALAARKKAYTIGIILTSIGNPFFYDIKLAISQMEEEYRHYGIKVELKEMQGFDAATQLAMIAEMEAHVSALILTPINHESIVHKLNELMEQSIPVITLNTDVENCQRLSYVGSNYYQGGNIAAGLLALIKPEGATLGIISGSSNIAGHVSRVSGFTESLSPSLFPIAEICDCLDDDIIAYENTKEMLRKYPAISTIFVATAGALGVTRAIASLQRDITLITFDETPQIIELLKQGKIHATISQQPMLQGRKAMELLFNFLVKAELPEEDYLYIENQIKIKENYSKS